MRCPVAPGAASGDSATAPSSGAQSLAKRSAPRVALADGSSRYCTALKFLGSGMLEVEKMCAPCNYALSVFCTQVWQFRMFASARSSPSETLNS